MKIFVTGASGYIGGSVAVSLQRQGHNIVGLTRSREKANALRELGITPVVGSLDDRDLLETCAKRSDVVINAADSDHAGAAHTLIRALAGSGKRLIHTSGSSIVGDSAAGEASESVFDEDTIFRPQPEKLARVAIDTAVRDAAQVGVVSVVICNSLIYGPAAVAGTRSVQLPLFYDDSRQCGVVRYIGAGRNVWSHVHIDDVVELYRLALEATPAGAFYFAEAGEASFGAVASAVAAVEGRAAISMDERLAIEAWGSERARFAMGSNSRVRGVAARRDLGWTPRGPGIFEAIAAGRAI
jgi:nucleoside-diphosphate-sugar epimerase